eukprot:g8978.t1
MTEGGYLVYTEDSLGTLFLKWSREPVENALAFFEAGKPIPPFKFTTNQGRFNATSLKVFEKQNAREDVQVVFLERNTSVVTRIEPGGVWGGDVTNLFAFAVVPKDNESYNCGTLDQNLFVSKAKMEGCGYSLN